MPGNRPGEIEIAERAGQAEDELAEADEIGNGAQDAVDIGFAQVFVKIGDGAAHEAENRPAHQQDIKAEDPAVGVDGGLFAEHPAGKHDHAKE